MTEQPNKYFLPGTEPAPSRSDLSARTPRPKRSPSLRFLVKMALKCDSAEQLGERLKRRFERQQRRQGTG